MPENDRRPHIVLPESGATERFQPTGARFSEAQLAVRNRRQHGRRLLAEVRAASQQAQAIIEEQRALGVDAGNGVYLEFEASQGFQLPTDRLESARSRIELLATTEQENTVRATVFVPEGGLVRFERLVQQYLERDSASGRPRN